MTLREESHPMTTTAPESPVRRIRIAPVPAYARATSPISLGTQCSTCHLKDLCLPCGLCEDDLEQLDRLTFARRRVAAGQTLYREGDKFQFIYAVRMGTFKSNLTLADGREQISAFHMPGEVMGLDGLAQDKHASNAPALEDSEVCAISFAHLNELTTRSGNMQHAVSRLMSREIVREHNLMMLLGSMNAEERLGAFLLNQSRRLQVRGYSSSEFHLRMSRAEIGSYLGLKLETVSRTFSAFQQQGLLEVDKRFIRIVDLEGLARLFEPRAH
jgi:CRP/FNR family transcriptional regulator